MIATNSTYHRSASDMILQRRGVDGRASLGLAAEQLAEGVRQTRLLVPSGSGSSGPCLIFRSSRNRNSASSNAYRRANVTNDRKTCGVLRVGETASSVRRTFHTIHGCRPTSAVHHPAIVATSVRNTVDTKTHKSQRGMRSPLRRCQTNQPTTPIRGNRNPRSIIRWYAWKATFTGAQSFVGNVSMPGTVASKLPYDRKLSKHGTPMAYVFSEPSSTQPIRYRGAQDSDVQFPSIEANFSGWFFVTAIAICAPKMKTWSTARTVKNLTAIEKFFLANS